MNHNTFKERLTENFKTYASRPALSDPSYPDGMTYAELEECSAKVRAWLIKEGIGKEQIVMINMPRGVELFAVCIGVWRAGAAYTVVEDTYPKERTDYITMDCGCVCVINAEVYKEMMKCAPDNGWEDCDPHTAAYAVYTSGTTGTPKGVMHEMGQIAAFINSANYKGRPFSRYTDKFMMLSPSNFVASVLLMILLLSTGGQLAIVPYSVVKNPSALREYMLNEKITGSFMTPSLAMIFTAGQEKKDNKHPFNPEFRILLLSSEPARNIWFSDLEIYNVFGQSETFFLGGVFNVDKPYEVTPIGSSMLEGTTLTLRDVKGCMGEICIENPYFRGYINLKEMTDYALRDGIYHTGDIGKYTDSGDIVILGRNDDMVKINGNRVEPDEIEAAAKKVLGVKWCAAKAFVKPDRAYVCVYHTEDTQVEETEAIRSMSEMLPEYMVPARIMKIDSVPVNANGKMNRRALPEPIIERSEDYVAPRNDIEERICKAFSDILGISSVGTADDFYRMGGDSMKTIRLIGKLGISGVSAADIFRERTARNIAAFVMRMNTNDNKDELKTEKNARKKRYPLTDIQLDFCNIQQKYPESMMWVLPILYSFDIKEEEKLIEAVDKVKRTNAIFATVLEKDDNGTMWQRYDESVLSPTIAEQVTEEDIQSFRTEMKHRDLPFKMTGSPLAKIYVMRTEKGLYMLLLIHHVITDGMGIGAVIQNIKNSFAGKELLVDCYYTWLEHEFNDTNAESKLRSKHTLDALYSDVEWTCQIQPSSEERGTENGVFGVFVPITEEQLARKEKEFGVSRTALFAGVMILALARCTDRKDILINWIFSNRGDLRSDNISGILIRSLALGVRLGRCDTLKDMFREVREQFVTNIACSNYEWVLQNPPKQGDDRLFFVYEDDITDYDVFKDEGGEFLPMLSKNQSAVHDMSAQILKWSENGTDGMLIACYYILSRYNGTDMEKFRKAIDDTANLVFMTPDAGDKAISDIVSPDSAEIM